ncbi:hypothetical protein DL96DRAFT_1711247 [Flagelloscypha sp. PMI_526]|nr:hypothetical protein DL96DRAFT_1711247 [Flagelloscypha sp. PMI_526]
MAAIPLDGNWFRDFMDNFHDSGIKIYKPNPTYLAWLEKASAFPMRSIFVGQEEAMALGKSTAELLEKIVEDRAQKLGSVSPQPIKTEESNVPKALQVLNTDSDTESILLTAKEVEWDQLTRTCKAAETLALLPELPIPYHVLSADIVYYILRFAAGLSSAEAKTLSLVSHQVQTWVDPFIFRYLAPKSRYEKLYEALETEASPRLARANDIHFKGVTVFWDIGYGGLARLVKSIPALRSLSFIAHSLYAYRDAETSKVLRSRIFRLHIDGWNPTLVSLADNLIASNNLTHLSLKVYTHNTQLVSQRWDWTPLRKLSKLEYFLLHTDPARFFHTISENVAEYHVLFANRLQPVLPDTLHVLIWVLPPIIKQLDQYFSSDIERYKRLLDGTVIPCMVVAFQAERVGCCETSESAAAHKAFVYPDASVHPAPRNKGLGWLESDLYCYQKYEKDWEFHPL